MACDFCRVVYNDNDGYVERLVFFDTVVTLWPMSEGEAGCHQVYVGFKITLSNCSPLFPPPWIPLLSRKQNKKHAALYNMRCQVDDDDDDDDEAASLHGKVCVTMYMIIICPCVKWWSWKQETQASKSDISSWSIIVSRQIYKTNDMRCNVPRSILPPSTVFIFWIKPLTMKSADEEKKTKRQEMSNKVSFFCLILYVQTER